MSRRISRRDFMNGVAVAVAASREALGARTALAQPELPRPRQPSPFAPEASPDYYPPASTGLRGSHPGSFEVAHAARDGEYARFPAADVDDRERYDLVVVGGGLSGLAAAYFYRQIFGPESRILILDNHDDFGGHAKRNEFRHGGRLFIGYGGTMSIETPFPYSNLARSLIRELGIEVEREREFTDDDLYRRHGLGFGMFFASESFAADRLVAGYGTIPWAEFFSAVPLSEAARRDLLRLYTGREDYLAGLPPEEKRARLSRMSYRDYLVQVARVSEEALPFFGAMIYRNAMHVDTAPALHAAQRGAAGFDGLGLDLEPQWEEGSYHFHFPDGNATVARLLVHRLIPAALPGKLTMESVVPARLDYSRLDDAGSPVRLRLNSTVVRVENEGPAEQARAVRVAYVRGGKVHEARAGQAILACYNSIIRFLVPELPARQKEALSYAVKVPLLYTNVFLRSWTSFRKLGVSSLSAPGMYHSYLTLDTPVSIGGYRCSQTPEEPIVVHMTRYPTRPGLPRREQNRAGMRELLATSFEQIELEIRRQLARILGPGGFDPAGDILAITANRWPHGYAYTYDTLGDPDLPAEERPHVIGRKPFGRIAIANSDAGAAAFTNTAIDEAHRAVQDLLQQRGMI